MGARSVFDPEGSRRAAVVMTQKATQKSLAADMTELRRVVDGQVFRWSRCSRRQSPIAESLVGAMFIEKRDELSYYVV